MGILAEPTKKWRKVTGYRIAKLCMKCVFRGTERVKRIDELNYDEIDEFYCTKFLCITRTFNLLSFFQCHFIVSQVCESPKSYLYINNCGVLCDYRDSASSISTFLTLAVTDLLSTRKFILPTKCIFISFMVQNTIMLYNSILFE